MGVFQAFGRDEEPAPHECPLLKQTWLPIFGNGTGSTSLQLPDHAAFIIQPGTQYIVQLHLQNNSDEPLPVRAGVNLTYDHDPSVLTPAGMYAFGTMALDIPANTTNYVQNIPGCHTGKEMDVFAVFPHMHKLGTKLDMKYTAAGSDEQTMLYQIDPWQFGNQPMVPLTKHIGADDSLDMSCTYKNNLDHDVTYGESSDNEMCYFIMFYTPFDGLDGCILGS
jgi:hypothetical protein